MPTIPSQRPDEHRELAESFGVDPARYDRARPRYPEAMVHAVVDAGPGRDVLDVGCGTGIAARQFQAAGCRVLGVDVDARMAEFARRGGLDVEVGKFELWDPADRTFDIVIAGQTWHWVEPAEGAAKAAKVLRAGGRLALFWNMFDPPPAVAEAFSAVYRRVVPDLPYEPWTTRSVDPSSSFFTRPADGIRAAGAFSEPEHWRFAWQRSYTRDEWIDQLPTAGGHSRLPADTLRALVEGTAAAIDAWGGSFVMDYTTMVITAVRDRHWPRAG
jgi:SAM-dependent methyltransferase